ncbi:hypothetical protein KRR38_07665 [Novosphingobium sp. G106]|uniref:hypothetical protein n=1 Tax=Novosphingobium sp. G106 TaxID=2849500 RepID=UPI001C2CF4F0|nr:hypothetical protein [Novosphingobium sp. G106]MBV1687559.1 hypothetical protein [Novosphingobium sp. G106]
MTRNARIVGYAIGLALLAGGGALCIVDAGGGIGLLILGALIAAGIALEPRYGRPRDTAPPSGNWQRTGERFVDDESGDLVEVWYNPATGERRYTQADS